MRTLRKTAKTKPDSALGAQTAPKALSGGYGVLELLFYIAFFSVLSSLVINAMITMARSFKETTIQAELVQSGSIMERMSREIRQANGIISIGTNDLVLDAGSGKTTEFKFISPNIQLWDTGSNIGNLNSPNTTVTALAFTQINTTKGKAVKIVLTLKSANDTSGNTQDFYDTIVLRGSY
ncbi:MAG: hypothetical protein PHT16_00315 [Candidatus Pacebacteria bacterium]|nr:hypothetical protein [Candidatus Paceibacterota bacterium]